MFQGIINFIVPPKLNGSEVIPEMAAVTNPDVVATASDSRKRSLRLWPPSVLWESIVGPPPQPAPSFPRLPPPPPPPPPVPLSSAWSHPDVEKPQVLSADPLIRYDGASSLDDLSLLKLNYADQKDISRENLESVSGANESRQEEGHK